MAFVLGIVTLTVLLLLLMMNYAEVDRYNGSIADLKSQLTDLQKEADKLEQRLDRKDDLVYFETKLLMGIFQNSGIRSKNMHPKNWAWSNRPIFSA